MLKTRDFYGDEFFIFCQQQFDNARRELKRFGKPKDEIDRFFISYHRETVRIFGGMLDTTERVKEIHKRNSLSKEKERLLMRIADIDAYLSTTGC